MSTQIHSQERLARIDRIKDAAIELMQGNGEAAVKWLHTPQELLGNETPIEHASTEMGARDVEDLINRIRNGVFS
ncbi:MAG: MbcA/ParS/Xre antitoxin family protein [Motiliproteus sp.]